MSDLAPLVFAVLCDKSNADMKEENDSLRQENDALRRQLLDVRAVKITGRDGSPVFARAQLEDGHLSGDHLHEYYVKFPEIFSQLPAGEHPMYACLPRDFGNLEVRIGGLGRIECLWVLGRFRGGSYNQGNRFGLWFSSPTQRSAFLGVAFAIGPFPSRAEFEEFHQNNFTHLQDERYQSLRIYFHSAVFDPDAISGLIDNFEQRRRQAKEQMADQSEKDATRHHEEEAPTNDAGDNDA